MKVASFVCVHVCHGTDMHCRGGKVERCSQWHHLLLSLHLSSPLPLRSHSSPLHPTPPPLSLAPIFCLSVNIYCSTEFKSHLSSIALHTLCFLLPLFTLPICSFFLHQPPIFSRSSFICRHSLCFSTAFHSFSAWSSLLLFPLPLYWQVSWGRYFYVSGGRDVNGGLISPYHQGYSNRDGSERGIAVGKHYIIWFLLYLNIWDI